MKGESKDGINVVAIHQHMTDDEPHYFFVHYWGKGKATELAQIVKRVLDIQAEGARDSLTAN